MSNSTIKSNSYVSLHNHTNLGSIRDSVARIEPLVSRAKAIGMESLGLTEHGNLSSLMKFYKECKKQSIKPVIGQEAYYTPHEDMKDKTYHLCIYAKNNIGLKNLYKISSSAYINHFYRKPRVTQELLFNNSEGLIVASACMQGPFSRMFIDGDEDGSISSIKEFSEHFGDDFYLEVHNHGIEDETRAREFIRSTASDLKIKCIGSTDVHMVNKSDRQIHNIYKQLSYGSVGKSDDDAFEGEGYHLLDYEEYGELFTEDEAYNTLEIADKCNISIKHSEYHLPKFDTGGVLSYEYIKDLSYKGLKRIGKDGNKEYIDRLEYELNIIHLGGLEDYFLINSEIVNWCNENDILVGPGRGSGAGSLLGYCLGITTVDPITYNLIFSRMLNAGRLMQYKFLED
jgi:DNA polymerase-3 subunit alpha